MTENLYYINELIIEAENQKKYIQSLESSIDFLTKQAVELKSEVDKLKGLNS